MEEKRKILLFGLGYFELQLLKAVSQQWPTIAIDINEEKINRLREEMPEAEFLAADASSILTWKKLDIQEIIHIITTIHDADVNLEICRIVRDVLQREIPITLISYHEEEDDRFARFNVTMVNPLRMGIGFIQNLLEKNYVKAVDIGLKKGEIIEVPILSKSHLVDRRLSTLRPTKWHVAAIYRDGAMIIPSGDNQIRIKDRVVLLGEPKVLENVASILLRGDPQFPLQFGGSVIFPTHDNFERNREELNYIVQHIKAKKLVICPYGSVKERSATEKQNTPQQKVEAGAPIKSLKHLFSMDDDTGMVFLPFTALSPVAKMQLKNFFRRAAHPFFLSRLQYPYKGIIASLNCPDPAYALELGIDLSRLFKVPFHAVYIAMPRELGSAAEEGLLKKCQELVNDFESIHKIKIPFTIREGNPVRETLTFAQEHPHNLVVLLYNRKDRFSVFNPHVPYYIAKKSPLSTLLIPVEAVYES
jgi:hypothetical protein